jgi:hypothetical protein
MFMQLKLFDVMSNSARKNEVYRVRAKAVANLIKRLRKAGSVFNDDNFGSASQSLEDLPRVETLIAFRVPKADSRRVGDKSWELDLSSPCYRAIDQVVASYRRLGLFNSRTVEPNDRSDRSLSTAQEAPE